jgi:NAD-dependent deacetylase
MFGELIPPRALVEAERLAAAADVLIVVGTSATVFPAAQLPFTAKSNGAFIIESNTEPTSFTTAITDVFLEGRAGEVLPQLLEML